MESLAHTLAARLLHTYSSLSRKTPRTSRSRQPLGQRRLDRVCDFIEHHLEDDITVAQLAAVANLSQFHFSRAFKAATGKAPFQYVSDRRLALAKVLLLESDRPLSDIAHRCRFASSGNFSRAFYRATGVTPAQFRQGQLPCGTQARDGSGDPSLFGPQPVVNA
jgi:AraC family transcriptional regulator